MYRKTYVEVDLNKIENNINKIINKYNDYKYYLGVVKNNAYSHGIEVIKTMIKAGINYLCVSSLEEALDIRKINKEIPVLILEPIDINYVTIASDNNLTITIDNKDYFNELKNKKIKIKFHLKVDTGMNRFGLKNKEDITYIVNNSNKSIYLEGIYSHLTSGNLSIYNKSINTFKDLTSDIDLNKIDIIHLDRSLTLEHHEKEDFVNGCRLGIIMYGFARPSYIPSMKDKIISFIKKRKLIEYKSDLNLETTFSFYTNVIEIKKVNKDEIIGYNGMYKAEEDELIGILPFGFADFIYDTTDHVSINNKLYKILVINMDVTIIKIDNNIKLGDKVEVFGNNISIKDKARIIGVNPYKLMTGVLNRVPRVYKYNGKEKEIKY